MTDFIVRPDCNQLLFTCQKCHTSTALDVPYPVVHLPCPNCDAHVLVEAVVITTRTLAVAPVRRRVYDWLNWHLRYNISQPLWAAMLCMPYKHREP